MLIANGRPLLTDFSIATVAGAPVPLRGAAVMGSPGYVAPERLHGDEGGGPADLFGLGATLFYAVMTVAAVASAPHLETAGGTVWFCGAGCRDAYAADPVRHAS